MRLDVYSHSFMISGAIPPQKKVIEKFCGTLVQYEMEIKEGVRSYSAKRVFASSDPGRNYYRLHINSLKGFLEHLAYHQIKPDEYETVVHEAIIEDRHRIDLKVLSLDEPRDPQPAIIQHILNDGYNKIVTLQTGKGKAVASTTPIRTPGGCKQIGKLKKGDYVIAGDGTPTKVIGVYPQGEKQLYTVTFADGRSVEACAEHLWYCFYVNTGKHNRWRVRDTAEMNRLINLPNPRVYIPLPEPEEMPRISVPIHPYVLGVIIGDGAISGPTVGLSVYDEFIIEQMRPLIPRSTKISGNKPCVYSIINEVRSRNDNAVKAGLIHLDLMGKVANSKFIPRVYLRGSIEQRWDLLQGLMDTDGTVQKSGSITYGTVSQQLALDVQELVRSLGGIACIRPRQTYYTWKGEKKAGQPSYEVDIRHKTPSKFFRLPKKKDRTNDLGQYNTDLKLRVKSIEPSRVADATCIAVDHPEKLFVTKDYIVTHNTFLTKYSFKELGVRSAFFMKGSFIERWIPDMDESFDLRGQAILNVRGKEALSSVMHMALDGSLQKTKAIFISITTYNTYVNEVETYGVSETYPIAPGEFFDKLNIGMAVLDEGHQNPHQVMKIFCYTHVPKFVTLSATLDTMDAFMNKIYELMYPREERCNGDYYDKYIAVTTIKFQLNRPNRIRYKGFGGAYSHTTFEASMMTHKNKVEMDNYLKLIAWSVKEKFVDVMEKGQKLLVFCGTIKFCTLVQKHLQKLFPQLTVGRYVGGDKMSVFDASDIIVSTVLSAGTAVDILNLRISIMTTAIDSQQSCEQVLGRTRRMKGWPEITPQFFYFCCTSIDKHVKYDRNKQGFFADKVLSHGSEQAPVMV